MKIPKNKTLFAIAFIVILTISALMVTIPTISAHDPPWTISTWAFLSVEPNPIGVGQTAYIGMWIDKVPPTSIGRYWGYNWHNMTLTVTKPNGDTQIMGPYDSDAVGGAWAPFVPDQQGEYKFQFHFPEQIPVEEDPYPYGAGFISTGEEFLGDTYLASTSKEVCNFTISLLPDLWS